MKTINLVLFVFLGASTLALAQEDYNSADEYNYDQAEQNVPDEGSGEYQALPEDSYDRAPNAVEDMNQPEYYPAEENSPEENYAE